MHLVDDVDLLFQKRGGVYDLLADVPDVFYAVVACGVHFNDVSRVSGGHGKASLAFPAGVAVNRGEAVYCLRQYLCAGGLSRPARAAEKVCVCGLSVRDLVPQNACYMILSDDRRKIRRTPFSVQSRVQKTHLTLKKRRGKQQEQPDGLVLISRRLPRSDRNCLMLLGSPPDMVRSRPPRKTCLSA